MHRALLLFAVACTWAGALGTAPAEVVDRVLAVVAGQVVTLSDARAALEFGLIQPRKEADPVTEAVEFLVNRQLMLNEVNRYSAPAADSALVEARLAALRARFGSQAAYEQALARSALTETRLRDILGDNVRIEGYLDQRFSAAAQPTSEEVERYYLDHPVHFTRNGVLQPLEDIQAEAFERVTTERRNSLIADWLDRLRRRFPVTVVYPGPR